MGHTLMYPSDVDFAEAWKNLLENHAKSNPMSVSGAEIAEYVGNLYRQAENGRNQGLELPMRHILQTVSEHFGVMLNCPLLTVERTLLKIGTRPRRMPYALELSEYLYSRNIHTGVVCNSPFSGAAITSVFREHFRHPFDFVISSADTFMRKPLPLIFDLAVRKSGVDPSSIWFCGDDAVTDVTAAYRSGMFPIWYTDKTVDRDPFRGSFLDDPWEEHNLNTPGVSGGKGTMTEGKDYLRIESLQQLEAKIEEILKSLLPKIKRHYYYG